MPQARLSGDRFQFTYYHAHHGGLPFAVTPDERHLLPSLDFYLRIPENHLLGISHGQSAAFVGNVARAWSRRKLDGQGSIVRLVYLYPFQFLQGLYTTLHLIGFGRLVSKCTDEIFRFLNHALLVLISRCLLGDSLRPQFRILGIWHLVVIDAAKHKLNGPPGDIVKEAPVMRNQHHSTFIFLQIALQPLD